MSDSSTSTTGFVWSVEGGGAISVSGLYTAPSASQETPATITAMKSSKKGTATVNSIYVPATIVAKGPIPVKIGGDTITFAELFTATNSSASNYTFVASPSNMTTSIDETTGLVTLAANANGSLTIKATHKTQASVTATGTISNVYPKATITGKSLTGKVGGDVIPFADMFTSNKIASEYNYVLTPTGEVGSINTSTGALTLLDTPTDEVMNVKATHKTQTSVTATATITATPKVI